MFEFEVITLRGGRFLEAPVAGSQQLSNDGMLVIVAAGDRTVYEDCSSCFQAIGKTSFFLGMLCIFIFWVETVPYFSFPLCVKMCVLIQVKQGMQRG